MAGNYKKKYVPRTAREYQLDANGSKSVPVADFSTSITTGTADLLIETGHQVAGTSISHSGSHNTAESE